MKTGRQMAEHYGWRYSCNGWRLPDSESHSVKRERMSRNTFEQFHCPMISDPFFYLLPGRAKSEIEGRKITLVEKEGVNGLLGKSHKISNSPGSNSGFLVVTEPRSPDDRIKVLDHSDEIKEAAEALGGKGKWLRNYFEMESNDMVDKSNAGAETSDKAACLFFAKYKKEIVDAFRLLKINEVVFEPGKNDYYRKWKRIGHCRCFNKISLDYGRAKAYQKTRSLFKHHFRRTSAFIQKIRF